MRRVDRLIAQVRRQTENEDFSSTTGIQDAEFLQYMNDAQHRLQGLILAQHPNLFYKEVEIDIIPNQESYSIPTDAFLFNKVVQLDYSPTGSEEDYYPLQLISIKNRNSGLSGHSLFYIRQNGQLLLSPVPTTGAAKLRLTYIKRIYELDTRRGIVSEHTLSGQELTSLTLDPTGVPAIDSDALNEEDYICIVDRDGTMKVRNIPIESVDASTGEVEVVSGFELEDGESISAGDYVVRGQDTTTHSELPRNAERYLLAYCAFKILARDSSTDVGEQSQELMLLEKDIVDSYADIEDDVVYIPILNDWDREGYE